MSELSRFEIIRANPIRKGLDSFRSAFTSSAEEVGLPASLEVLDRMNNEGNTYHCLMVLLLMFA
jgi:hypothetical protein